MIIELSGCCGKRMNFSIIKEENRERYCAFGIEQAKEYISKAVDNNERVYIRLPENSREYYKLNEFLSQFQNER